MFGENRNGPSAVPLGTPVSRKQGFGRGAISCDLKSAICQVWFEPG